MANGQPNSGQFTASTPTSFKNMPKEELARLSKMAKEARRKKCDLRREYREYMEIIGNSPSDLNGVEVPKDFIVIYKLYEKACAGNLDAIKILLDIENKKVSNTQVIQNIIKLKID